MSCIDTFLTSGEFVEFNNDYWFRYNYIVNPAGEYIAKCEDADGSFDLEQDKAIEISDGVKVTFVSYTTDGAFFKICTGSPYTMWLVAGLPIAFVAGMLLKEQTKSYAGRGMQYLGGRISEYGGRI